MQEKSHSWNYKTEMFVSSSKKKQICLKQKSVVEQVMQFIKTDQKEVTAILVLRQEILVHTTVESINALQHYWPWEQVRFAVCSSNNSAQTLAEGSCKRQGGCGCWEQHISPGTQAQVGHSTHLECSRGAKGAANPDWALCKQSDSLGGCKNDFVTAGCSAQGILIHHLSDTWTAI